MQLSLELEYWTVDDTGALASARPVLERIDDLHAESADPMLEIVTDPCDDVPELREEVTVRLREAIEVAQEEGRHLVPLGTPLNAGPVTTSDGPRTRIQREVLGEAFENATHCAGTHLHVDQIEGAVTDQLNLLTALDPAFALVASSSYNQGHNVAACARSHVYRQTCYGDHPQLGQLWPYVEDVAEWDDRIDAAFDQFRRQALSYGVEPATFDAHFTPEDSIWAPVRLREKFDTIEWRAPDVALPGQILRLVEDIRDILSLVPDRRVEIGGRAGVTTSTVSIPAFDRLQQYVKLAIDHGLEDLTIRRYLETMGFDTAAYRPISAELGNTSRMSQERAQWLRLRYADRLEREVEALTVEQSPAWTEMTQSAR
ncbi:glutamate--cysteine ligase GCS2 (plasmid) [Haloterrigena turkmenica DSM 5511]|uniref:Glutamate--cysteine ligase GCS2 n=1 Tax=Haloterrigena turkmenica (strain ATCC 51198 / DSM 5511 / JCM 9101 / NCIMB 13204 / VKM B-1734 / 4k) TaxID=543526 RepID=D2S2W6_HALTV|nr:glutamate-cysteine ligase family protein [Haloterrigena turkmenica]ADB63713.1 glutamate--cysteine ligase GCS2 [Haloterrigena turkmenica DSM 5511]